MPLFSQITSIYLRNVTVSDTKYDLIFEDKTEVNYTYNSFTFSPSYVHYDFIKIVLCRRFIAIIMKGAWLWGGGGGEGSKEGTSGGGRVMWEAGNGWWDLVY